MHPLMEDLTGLSDTQLQDQMTKLNRVMRTTTNGEIAQQALMILDSLRAEQMRRYDEILEKAQKSNKKLSDSIDIS